MKTLKSTLLLLLFIPVQLVAQVFYEDTYAGETSVCVTDFSGLSENPGADARQIGSILFGEELEHLGKEAFVRGENTNYIKVRTRDGKVGWIEDKLVVRNGGVAVVTKEAQIYEKPNTLPSMTTMAFQPGEVVILSRDFSGDWLHLTGPNKEKAGWIQGFDKVSVEPKDVQMAALYRRAMNEDNLVQRRKMLEDIARQPNFLQSELAGMITNSLRETYYATGTMPPSNSNTRSLSGGADGQQTRSIGTQAARFAPAPSPSSNYSITVKEVVDMETGKSYQRVIETGTVQPVAAKDPKTKYYCYHKTLPMGTKVLLQIPGEQGFVQLEVIAPLRKDNPHMIGLGKEVLQNIYGANSAREIKTVTITYPRP